MNVAATLTQFELWDDLVDGKVDRLFGDAAIQAFAGAQESRLVAANWLVDELLCRRVARFNLQLNRQKFRRKA